MHLTPHELLLRFTNCVSPQGAQGVPFETVFQRVHHHISP